MEGGAAAVTLVVGAGAHTYVQHIAESLGCKRSERLEGDCKVSANLDRDVKDGGCPVDVGLGNLPRLGIRNVFVAQSGYCHRVLEGLAEAVVLDVLFN